MIDFSDVSFLIPIRIDSKIRADNLAYIVQFLLSNFKTSICIYEDDSSPKIPSHLNKDIIDKCSYRFFKNDQANNNFNKAKLLNFMSVDCGSSIMASLDSDCFIQDLVFYKESIQLIRDGKFDLIHPHDKCIRYDVSSPKFYLNGNMQILKKTRLTANNTGGFLFISINALLKMGMWNESFDSWGGEDSEFYCRSVRFGIKSIRLPGTLIHLNHPKEDGVGFYAKPREENVPKLEKSRTLSDEDLKKEVENWPWVIEAKEKFKKNG